MDIKQLNYFVTVVEEGNISAAAKKLHICQPPLSHQIKLIEQELGVVLMIRGSRKITLTETGKLLYKRAKNIISITESALNEIEDMKNGISGSISIGLATSCELSIFQKYIIEFHEEFPQVSFKFIEGNTDNIITALHNGDVEIAVVRTPFNHENLVNIGLASEPLVAVYNHKFDLGDADSLTLSDLKDKPLIIYRRFEPLITNSFNEENLEPNIFCLNDDTKTSLLCAKNGLGIALLPLSTVYNDGNSNLTVKEIDKPELVTQIKVVYSKKHALSRIGQALLDKISSYNK